MYFLIYKYHINILVNKKNHINIIGVSIYSYLFNNFFYILCHNQIFIFPEISKKIKYKKG
jgi:hypothetical protein